MGTTPRKSEDPSQLLDDVLDEFDSSRENQCAFEAAQRSREFSRVRNEKYGRNAIFAVCALSLMISIRIGIGPLDEREPWIEGNGEISDEGLRKAVSDLWTLREAVDIEFSKRRVYPKDLAALIEAELLEEVPICPLSEDGYVVRNMKGKTAFVCGDVAGNSLVWLAMEGGPPVVEVSEEP